MAFKVSNSKKNNRQKYIDIELEDVRKHPTAKGIYRVGSRIGLRVPQRVYQEGKIVKYEGQPHLIRKSTKKGIYVSGFKEDEKGFMKLEDKEKFIKIEDVKKGKVYPYYPYLAFGLI